MSLLATSSKYKIFISLVIGAFIAYVAGSIIPDQLKKAERRNKVRSNYQAKELDKLIHFMDTLSESNTDSKLPGQFNNFTLETRKLIYETESLSTSEKVKILSSVRYSYKEEDELFTSLFDKYFNESLILESNRSAIPKCKLDNNTLVFKDIVNFREFMESITNRKLDEIQNWENSMGFTSLRKKLDRTSLKSLNKNRNSSKDGKLNSAHYPESSRIADTFFESVLSDKERVIVGDTLFQFNFKESYVRAINIETADSVWAIHYFRSNGSRKCTLGGEGNFDKICTDKSSDDCIFFNTRVWSQYYYLHSSIGASMFSYHLSPNGTVKRHISPSLQFTQDHFDHMEYSNCNVNSRWNKLVYNAHKTNDAFRCVKVFDSNTGYSAKSMVIRNFADFKFWYDDLWRDRINANLNSRINRGKTENAKE